MGVFAAIALAAAVTMLATVGHDLLPPLFLNRSDAIYTNLLMVNSVTIALSIVATAMLFRKRKSVLDMWLLVAFSGWLVQSLLILTLQARFTLGWYSPVRHDAGLASRRDAGLDRRVQSALCAAGPVDGGAESGTRSPADVDGRGGGRHLP